MFYMNFRTTFRLQNRRLLNRYSQLHPQCTNRRDLTSILCQPRIFLVINRYMLIWIRQRQHNIIVSLQWQFTSTANVRRLKKIMKNQGKLKTRPSMLRRMGTSKFWLSPILQRVGSIRSQSFRGREMKQFDSNGLSEHINHKNQQSASFVADLPHEGARFPKQFVREMCDMADINLDDLIYLTLMNDLEGVLPYFIALDREERAVVISIRGSVSLADWITDAMFEPRSFQGFLSQEVATQFGISDLSKEYAHNGMFNCALAILKDLETHKILDLLFRQIQNPKEVVRINDTTLTISLKDLVQENVPDCTGWNLVLTGHSLGAGVATIMALKLMEKYQNIRIWCYNPPGGLLSPSLAEKLSPFCVSVVQHKDLVSRLSSLNLQRFRDKMVYALALCKRNKNVIIINAIRNIWRKQQLEDIFWSEAEIPQEVRQVLSSYKQSIERDIEMHGMQEMIPPGRVVHVRYLKRDDRSDPFYSAVWVSGKDLIMEGFLLSPHVGIDHDQVNVMDVIMKVDMSEIV
eukprot:TRINITY_DN462_c0_g1_i7.p1 TRINITY_DN462_c0_g1~~TRINITY_DN462_c0_g1_i7.p1  ORF type:complete len:518 (-),score=32.08 TRINITY_DN462_c0_g1_i7:187-1740(-)